MKELHYFTRGRRYKASSRATISSPWRRLADDGKWGRREVLRRVGQAGGALLGGDWGIARWWWRAAVGRYGDAWYRECFRPGLAFPHRGEITPAYALLEDADVARIKALNPDMRLLFLVRDPVERAWSGLCRRIGHGEVQVDLQDEEALLRLVDRRPIHQRCDYERTLATFLRHFDGRQILIGFHDATFADPEGLLSAVADFLGIAPFTEPRERLLARDKPSLTLPMPDRVRAHLQERYVAAIDRMAASLGSYAAHWGHRRAAHGGAANGAVNGALSGAPELVPARHP